MDADGPLIHGDGTPESAWAACAWLQSAPVAGLAELLRGANRLVVVSPHPDDEVLGCGGTMALAARAGVPVLVVAATDGEACYPDDPEWHPARLGSARRSELEDAMREIAPDARIEALSLPDGKLGRHLPALTTALAERLRPDDLLLAPWRHDGHPDHEAAYAASRAAALHARCALLEYPVWGWHWAAIDEPRMTAARPVRVRLAGALDAKRRALACFRTQTGRCDPPVTDPVLPPHVQQRFRRDFEVFFT